MVTIYRVKGYNGRLGGKENSYLYTQRLEDPTVVIHFMEREVGGQDMDVDVNFLIGDLVKVQK